jgi:murein endopeptidase
MRISNKHISFQHRVNILVQDWVQLPTKEEMDSYRKQNAGTHFVCKQKLIVTSKTWQNKGVNLRKKEGVR